MPPQPTGDDIVGNPGSATGSIDRGRDIESHDKRVYDKKELASLVDALRRIGASELAQPPEFLGTRYAPKRYVLPDLPTNMMPEDIRTAF